MLFAALEELLDPEGEGAETDAEDAAELLPAGTLAVGRLAELPGFVAAAVVTEPVTPDAEGKAAHCCDCKP